MPQLMQGTPQWTLMQSSGRARSAGAAFGVQLSAYYLLAAATFAAANVAVALEIIAPPHVGRVESS